MTPSDDIKAVIARILSQECRVTVPWHDDTRLMEDLGLDSVGMLTLAMGLENHYQVVLDEDPEEPPRTLGQLERLVRERLG